MPAPSEQPPQNSDELDRHLEHVHAAAYFAAAIAVGVVTPRMQDEARVYLGEGSPPRRYCMGSVVVDGGVQ